MDCNNFYVSCERAFNPTLERKAVVVLSNNDGCVISRSNEAKLLGVPMGAPYFEVQKLCKAHGIEVFSSNYNLYGTISARIMNIIKTFTPDLEIYSIDEAFLRIDKLAAVNPIALCNEIISTIRKNTGIPVSIGLGSTKTLAKVANYHGKKNGRAIYDIRNKENRNAILEKLDVEDIWGIGKRIAMRLNQIGIFKASQLRDANYKMIRKSFGVIGEKIVHELNGISCLELELVPQPKKSIVVSRSFGRPVTKLEELEEALATYIAKACIKMRRQNAKVQGFEVFLVTNWYLENNPYYKNSKSFYFDLATDDTMKIITYAKHCLKKIFKPGYKYKKVGIMLLNLVDNSYTQTSLLSNAISEVKSAKLMKTIDSINDKMGGDRIFFAAQGVKRGWQMRADKKSPNYTSNWDQLILVG